MLASFLLWEICMSDKMFADIKKFHKQMGLEYEGEPRFLPLDMSKLRIDRLHEEMDEYRQARRDNNLVDQLDALVDLVYVALGTAYLHGFDFEEAWNRVHASNMLKERAQKTSDSKHKSQYDVIKPEGWVPPYLKDLA